MPDKFDLRQERKAAKNTQTKNGRRGGCGTFPLLLILGQGHKMGRAAGTGLLGVCLIAQRHKFPRRTWTIALTEWMCLAAIEVLLYYYEDGCLRLY